MSMVDEYASFATLVDLNIAPPIMMINLIFGSFWSAMPCTKKIEYDVM